ncbi:MAG: C_GCAxxG_C_C family protein, partial [Desulfobacterales bacterium]|nr:C_GCAxxG_C_C family protein [Desulfobacterales bacterium]
MSIPSIEHIHQEVKKTAERGLLCSQIIIDIGLRKLGMYSHDLVKGAGGLVGAIGLQGATCGALTGAACLLVFAGVDNLDKEVYLL